MGAPSLGAAPFTQSRAVALEGGLVVLDTSPWKVPLPCVTLVPPDCRGLGGVRGMCLRVSRLLWDCCVSGPGGGLGWGGWLWRETWEPSKTVTFPPSEP